MVSPPPPPKRALAMPDDERKRAKKQKGDQRDSTSSTSRSNDLSSRPPLTTVSANTSRASSASLKPLSAYDTFSSRTRFPALPFTSSSSSSSRRTHASSSTTTNTPASTTNPTTSSSSTASSSTLVNPPGKMLPPPIPKQAYQSSATSSAVNISYPLADSSLDGPPERRTSSSSTRNQPTHQVSAGSSTKEAASYASNKSNEQTTSSQFNQNSIPLQKPPTNSRDKTYTTTSSTHKSASKNSTTSSKASITHQQPQSLDQNQRRPSTSSTRSSSTSSDTSRPYAKSSTISKELPPSHHDVTSSSASVNDSSSTSQGSAALPSRPFPRIIRPTLNSKGRSRHAPYVPLTYADISSVVTRAWSAVKIIVDLSACVGGSVASLGAYRSWADDRGYKEEAEVVDQFLDRYSRYQSEVETLAKQHEAKRIPPSRPHNAHLFRTSLDLASASTLEQARTILLEDLQASWEDINAYGLREKRQEGTYREDGPKAQAWVNGIRAAENEGRFIALGESSTDVRRAIRLVVDGTDLHRAGAATAGNLALFKSGRYLSSSGTPTPISTARLLYVLNGSKKREGEDGFIHRLLEKWRDCRIGPINRKVDHPGLRPIVPIPASFSEAEKAIFHRADAQRAAGHRYDQKVEKFELFDKCEKDSEIGAHKITAECGGVFDFEEITEGSLEEVKEALEEDWSDPEWRADLWSLVGRLDHLRERETDPSCSSFDYRLLLDNHIILLAVLGIFDDLLGSVEDFSAFYREVTVLLCAATLSTQPSIYSLIISALIYDQFHDLRSKTSSSTFSAQYTLLNEMAVTIHGMAMCATVGCHRVSTTEGTSGERTVKSWRAALRDCFSGGGGEQETGDKSSRHEVRGNDLRCGHRAVRTGQQGGRVLPFFILWGTTGRCGRLRRWCGDSSTAAAVRPSPGVRGWIEAPSEAEKKLEALEEKQRTEEEKFQTVSTFIAIIHPAPCGLRDHLQGNSQPSVESVSKLRKFYESTWTDDVPWDTLRVRGAAWAVDARAVI
ncbi:hypothetical protein IAR55_003714 [Kwoniella newhampshirensis]|uniref:Uncharacterized protein n=1 Tax=Kwoniella newhampshirensis TaxID=1651941 RepID=A0AAW0YNF8_9TREE